MHFLENAIKSIKIQTYKNIEIIVVDDNSSDNTTDVVKKLNNKNIEIIYLRNDINKGVSATRNIGIKQATGKYILTLDDDNLLVPWAIDKLVKKIKQSKLDNLGGAYGWLWCMGENGKTLRIITERSNSLIKREIFENVGFYNEDLRNNEDLDFWLRVAKKYQFDYVPEILFVAKSHGQNQLSEFSKKNIKEYKEISDKYQVKSYKNNIWITNFVSKKTYIILSKIKNIFLVKIKLLFFPELKKNIELVKNSFIQNDVNL